MTSFHSNLPLKFEPEWILRREPNRGAINSNMAVRISSSNCTARGWRAKNPSRERLLAILETRNPRLARRSERTRHPAAMFRRNSSAVLELPSAGASRSRCARQKGRTRERQRESKSACSLGVLLPRPSVPVSRDTKLQTRKNPGRRFPVYSARRARNTERFSCPSRREMTVDEVRVAD